MMEDVLVKLNSGFQW